MLLGIAIPPFMLALIAPLYAEFIRIRFELTPI
jgi:hypothetical protein